MAAPAMSREEIINRILSKNPRAHVTPDGLVYLGELPPAQTMSIRLMNRTAADTTNADQLWAGGGLGMALTGSGVSVGLWDGGQILSTHQELIGRVTNIDFVTVSDHSTHVAGTIGAAGLSASARGMASSVALRSRDYLNDVTEMNADAAVIDLSNHSYGNLRGWTTRIGWNGLPTGTDTWFADRSLYTEDPYFGKYESAPNAIDLVFGAAYQLANAWALDQVLYTHPHLLAVWSAGNDRSDAFTNGMGTNEYVTYLSSGPSGAGFYLVTNSGSYTAPGTDGGTSGFDTLPQSQVAKNNLVVGAINDITVDPYTAGHVSLASFSAFGPTDDGRIKPDVVANGVSLYSSIGASTSSYAYYSGTSMSSPNACGTAALLLQHYRALNAGASPSSATLKAILLHTAFDAGTAGPDYKHGWGVIDAAKAVAFLNDSEDTAPNMNHRVNATYSGIAQDTILVSDGSQPLKATLVWTDPPAAVVPGGGLDDPTRVLVNDLDLSILGPPSSTTYFPWTLNPANPSAPAVRSTRNDVDNVEQVLIDSPPTGTYTIRVSHSGSAFIQPYALLITGAMFPAPEPCSFDFDDDGDVDLTDFAQFQTCFNGPNRPARPGCVIDADCDNDTDVDLDDFSSFQACFNGPNRPPACTN